MTCPQPLLKKKKKERKKRGNLWTRMPQKATLGCGVRKKKRQTLLTLLPASRKQVVILPEH
eukprot:2185796-Amphidinium_carterae.1